MDTKKIRAEIFYWFTLIVGLLIIGFQLYQFFTGVLLITWKDLVILSIGILLSSAPRVLTETATKAFNQKFNSGNDEDKSN